MKNLKSIIQYECFTSFKFIGICCAVQYAFLISIILLIGFITGSFEDGGGSGFEMCTLISIAFLGSLGFKNDFKMLIQNGFTRKYIFMATFSMVGITSFIMAFIDTIIGNLLHSVFNSYESLYGGIYGYGNFFMNWLWLFLFYILCYFLFYFFALVAHKIGKVAVSIIFVSIFICIGILFPFILSEEMIQNILIFLSQSMGFMQNGTIHHIFPILTWSTLILLFAASCYAFIRRMELKV